MKQNHILESICEELFNTATSVITLILKENLFNKLWFIICGLLINFNKPQAVVGWFVYLFCYMVTSDYLNKVLCFLPVISAAISSVQEVSILETFFFFFWQLTVGIPVCICLTLQLGKPCWHLQILLKLKTAYSLVKNKCSLTASKKKKPKQLCSLLVCFDKRCS